MHRQGERGGGGCGAREESDHVRAQAVLVERSVVDRYVRKHVDAETNDTDTEN
jgi:hypothetical protein